MLFYGDTSDLGPGEGVGVQLQAGGAAVDPAPAHQQPVLGGDGHWALSAGYSRKTTLL